ncbi:sigma-54-dependent Fis family transcriptional regulator [Paraburkholderia bannensis]|uniref:sigma-54-dependent Fis family transcriptional regulator n=1 Tax=Paraburkholderia bannensis TaxID=765414 RepID=UPI002AB7C454|nr:sigma-54-dependent Fis family transcriptional regulator [Paraburkholderia bannensis]
MAAQLLRAVVGVHGTTHVEASVAYQLQIANLVRDQLRSDGVLPEGVLREDIEASWRRSIDQGVRWYDRSLLNLPDAKSQEEMREVNSALLDAATPELRFLAERCSSQEIVILTDADAAILKIDGHVTPFKDHIGIRDIRPGACWSESVRGTNALGMALVEGRSVLVNSGEHFLDSLNRVSCRSMPIADPYGKILGVLDVTRDGPLPLQDTMFMLMNTVARHIERRLFAATFPEHVLVAIHSYEQYIDSIWAGLLAITDEGIVAGASFQACELLNLTREQVVGLQCGNVLQMRGAPFMTVLEQAHGLKVAGLQQEYRFKVLALPRNPVAGNILSAAHATEAVADSHSPLAALACGDRQLLRALQQACQGLNKGVPVLLQGETGTGKEVLAKGLHDASARSGKPFIAVNCAAIPEGLIESELFGYREGAFTGARKGGVVGRVMQAHGGTLFLDEIGDMPAPLQARLLRVLQERKVAPLGAGSEHDIDVAVICATHRDLSVLIRDKTFREDLYYRIKGFSINLPALRERPDIDLLVLTILKKLGAPEVRVSKELADVFRRHPWPGNIRQLEMVLRTALAVRGDGETELGLDHMCAGFVGADTCVNLARPVGLIREQEAQLIRNALEKHNGNVGEAAKMLGIGRSTLYRRIKELDE